MSNDTSENKLHNVLVVDDEAIVLAALRETLTREGYHVATASSAEEALGLLEKRSFSVVLTDQQMPKLTGLDFLALVKQRQPDATRILITGALSLAMVVDSINKGEIYRFIVKPWLREELIATVKNAVQRFEMICKNDALMVTTLAMNAELKQANAALSQNLQRSVELCLKTMETFYPTLGSQARRVHELCRAMGEGLNLAREERETLEVSAWLHDIGLVGVPRELIRRGDQSPASLSAAETALVQQHPVLGQELASFVHDLEAVGRVIRAHHERWDGKGFPDKLKGEKIPWLARLLAVAVAYAESPRDGVAAIERVKAGTGKAFDSGAVEAFLRCLPQASVARRQREVPLQELKPGMVLARGVRSRNGVVIVPDGQRLTEAFIDKIHRHHRLKPIPHAVLVYA